MHCCFQLIGQERFREIDEKEAGFITRAQVVASLPADTTSEDVDAFIKVCSCSNIVPLSLTQQLFNIDGEHPNEVTLEHFLVIMALNDKLSGRKFVVLLCCCCCCCCCCLFAERDVSTLFSTSMLVFF
jgi:hypothetical protein